jgi:FkbH-like protein
MTEPVRLLIWDLDETFWRGVLTEGGIEIVERHKEIVRELSLRGIVSSICSKNDSAQVEAILAAEGVADYFVAPSISWEPKGPRIAALVETLGLRPATVMFVDDNPLNLEEARRFCPGLQVRGAEGLSDILDDPLFAGKPDPDLTRLKQYKLLEKRRADERAAGADLTGFLRDSAIEVEIETDVEPHLDRFIELINRTNQLNFTKRRLPEDIEAARAEARRLLNLYHKQAALVRVRDRYGDHGFCGVYLHSSESGSLEHFAFSCRILGLGVERWLYQKLGRPPIKVQGDVLADLDDLTPVDWIGQIAPGGPQEIRAGPRIGRITARGSCDLSAIVHYFHYDCDDTAGEHYINRNGGVFRVEHSVFYYYAAKGLTPEQREAARRLGYLESDFATRLYDPALFDERGHLVILGFGADLTQPLIRHRGSGLIAPFPVPAPVTWWRRDITAIPDEDIPADFPAWAREALDFVRAEWDYLGMSRPQDFAALLRFAVAQIPASATICLLAFFTRPYVDKEGRRQPTPPVWQEFNAAMRVLAAERANVSVVEFDDLLDDDEIDNRLHLHRSALFKVYRRIRECVLGAAERQLPPADPGATA